MRGPRRAPRRAASTSCSTAGARWSARRWRPAPGPLRIDGGRLVLAVDEPAIATHVRFLQGELLARLEALLGPGRVTALDLRVGPKK